MFETGKISPEEIELTEVISKVSLESTIVPIIDDDPDVRAVVSGLLSLCNVEAREIDSIENLKEYLAKEGKQPHAFILDNHFCRVSRGQEGHQAIKEADPKNVVIALTTEKPPGYGDEGFELVKPVDIPDLCKSVSTAIKLVDFASKVRKQRVNIEVSQPIPRLQKAA